MSNECHSTLLALFEISRWSSQQKPVLQDKNFQEDWAYAIYENISAFTWKNLTFPEYP